MTSKLYEGVSPRGSSIRIIFTWNDQRYFPTLKLTPTPANLKLAASIRREILKRIGAGTFDFKEFFPESKHAKLKNGLLFKEVASSWLDSRRRVLAETTIREYRTTIAAYFGSLGDRVMADISFLELNELMSRLEISNKTFHNILSVLRCIYSFGMDAGAVTVNHAIKIEFPKIADPEPDPLNIEEMSKVLDDMRQHYPEPVAIYFNLAFRIGFRPSEGIDLRWENVDWERKSLIISSAKVRGIVKLTKTECVRRVEISDESIALLKRLRGLTASEHLFIHPNTGRPYADTSCLVQNYWRPALARCGIRDRDARQTRHTCATMLLMGGARDRWAAKQLGHSIVMFQRVYSTWLDANDNRQELAKANAMFARI
jgi:integrase